MICHIFLGWTSIANGCSGNRKVPGSSDPYPELQGNPPKIGWLIIACLVTILEACGQQPRNTAASAADAAGVSDKICQPLRQILDPRYCSDTVYDFKLILVINFWSILNILCCGAVCVPWQLPSKPKVWFAGGRPLPGWKPRMAFSGTFFSVFGRVFFSLGLRRLRLNVHLQSTTYYDSTTYILIHTHTRINK